MRANQSDKSWWNTNFGQPKFCRYLYSPFPIPILHLSLSLSSSPPPFLSSPPLAFIFFVYLLLTSFIQSKEKTIQELTERLSAGPEGGGNVTANLGELLRTQQDLLRAQQERDEYSLLVDQLRGNLQGNHFWVGGWMGRLEYSRGDGEVVEWLLTIFFVEVQSQAEADAEVYHSQLASSEELLEKERKRVQALQIDHLTRSSESANAHGEAERALAETKETLKARDAEVIKLKKQVC